MDEGARVAVSNLTAKTTPRCRGVIRSGDVVVDGAVVWQPRHHAAGVGAFTGLGSGSRARIAENVAEEFGAGLTRTPTRT